MKATELKFRAHEYTGREKGMMVIGSTTQLQQLSELLKAPIHTEKLLNGQHKLLQLILALNPTHIFCHFTLKITLISQFQTYY
ncbi:hypothetical protein ASG24_04490 [Methylophilus sp. Leaf414]|nr:hypothetical protein ASG24_04490 [Methylophilus sp. Leaf414]